MAMKDILLKPLDQPVYTLEAEAVTPDNFAGKSIEEILEQIGRASCRERV